MLRRTISLVLWIFVFQLITYFLEEILHFQLTPWYQTLNRSPLHPPEIVFPIIWSTLYVMITIAGWLLWRERKNPDAKTALLCYLAMIILTWAWTPAFFRWHAVGVTFILTIGILISTFFAIINAAEKYELPATLLTPYLLWLLYIAYLIGYVWLYN